MDHDQANQIQASARYVLGDLSPSEAEAFEEHFFSCQECAREMQLEAVFAENARAVFRDQARQASADPATGWFQRVRLAFAARPAFVAPLAAAACLLIVAGYQNVVTIPRLRTEVTALTSGEAPFSFPLKLARGDSAVNIPRDAFVFMPYFYLPQHTASAHYTCTFELPSGGQVLQRTISAPQPGQPLQILLRHSDFPSGTYLVKVRGEHSPEPIATYTMDINTY